MATQFIYQPHIHADGMVITPDLPLDRLLIWSGEAGPFCAPIKRIVTDQGTQTAAPAGVHAAVALVAASEGTLVAPAILVPASGAPAQANAGAEVAISRQAFRLKEIAAPAVALDGTSAQVVDPEAAIAAAGGTGLMLPYGTIVILATAESASAESRRYRSTLTNGALSLSHVLDLERLA
jgi:hypothetical protein